ncbi:DedA family protein [Alicyclobacillaceae bacterium I2511]|nr:DedA family protein [Alicyclobacillaceae bacterium I2511]
MERETGLHWKKLLHHPGSWWTVGLSIVGLGLGLLILYLDRQGTITTFVQAMGPGGVVVAVFLMALLCVTPIPSEGLLIVYLKVYGGLLGVLYAWSGAVLSSVLIFSLARIVGTRVLRRYIPAEAFAEVNRWVMRRGVMGLLIARMLPIPAFAVNYIAGMLPSIRLWPYVWTAGVSLIPYYSGAVLIFLGLTTRFTVYLLLGAISVAAIWAFGYLLNRHSE